MSGKPMGVEDEFDGDQCVVLPANYMASVDAAVELYDDDIAKKSTNFNVSGLEYGVGRLLFRIGLLAGLLWLVPSIWALCI
jgi:hypothetical protein